MANNIKTSNITSNNNLTLLNFSIISQCNWVIYIIKVVCMARFTLLTNIFKT